MKSLQLSQAYLGALLLSLAGVNGQGCSNTCPPINYGTPVPALCEGDMADTFANTEKVYDVCHGSGQTRSFSIDSLKGKIAVFANFYTGCNAGRRESGVFAHVAQRYFETHGEDKIVFIQSVKGGGTCAQWASIFQSDAVSLYPGSGIVPREMPLSVNDVNYEIRDDLFTTPFGHPSYAILDHTGMVRHKFIGPCCGYESFYSCTADIAKSLDQQLTDYLEPLLTELETSHIDEPTNKDPNVFNPNPPVDDPQLGDGDQTVCVSGTIGDWSEWSPCSVQCGSTPGIQFRTRSVQANDCTRAVPVETRSCQATFPCNDPSTACVAETGASYTVETVVTGLDSPRDVDFHPTPGLHLRDYSEGRQFYPDEGQEAWVVNGGNHSVSIVASLGTERQTTISRRDRGYYHYMINATALSFNKVANSGRIPDRDSFNYWAICNDNPNNYMGTKEANYFMGPTLYDSRPRNRNTVNRLGQECRPEEPCYFLHADMLHESPSCVGITHDPEVDTAYGTVYWAFDATGNRETGQLVRFDFQQPHGPGSMDHSVAAIRRYVEVELERGDPGVHAGMVVHPTRREVFVAVPGANKIIVVGADSGDFARTAREEYPIYSSALPSFEYSVWECVDQRVFAEGIDTPSGMALSDDGSRLFVAERGSGNILVFEIESASLLYTIETGLTTIGGMAFPPATVGATSMLYFVDEQTNSLYRINPDEECSTPVQSRVNPSFTVAVNSATANIDGFSLSRDYECSVDPIVPDASFFDQVHDDTGYADDNPDVQSNMTGMDAGAALLADRTDCGFDSELNFDALLLGGYFCHRCLPEEYLNCDTGGICSNVQWEGYTCDNEFFVTKNSTGDIELQNANGSALEPSLTQLLFDVTYRVNVLGNISLCANIKDKVECASKGPLLFTVEDGEKTTVSFTVNGENDSAFELDVALRRSDNTSSGVQKFGLTGMMILSMIALKLTF
ncbi:unnamed protein product [Cylindrotheca closterium]|uniref:Uncharacterized protein n=1 Tax=Cylindrotheca closterium TaxID=2856 RepID=A0AAD2FGD8_9STRA|nr:unnamed protein product [Cylindrotheca closterium]